MPKQAASSFTPYALTPLSCKKEHQHDMLADKLYEMRAVEDGDQATLDKLMSVPLGGCLMMQTYWVWTAVQITSKQHVCNPQHAFKLYHYRALLPHATSAQHAASIYEALYPPGKKYSYVVFGIKVMQYKHGKEGTRITTAAGERELVERAHTQHAQQRLMARTKTSTLPPSESITPDPPKKQANNHHATQ